MVSKCIKLIKRKKSKKKGWWIETCKLCTFRRLPSDTKNEYYFRVFPVQFWQKVPDVEYRGKEQKQNSWWVNVSSPTPCTSRHALLYNAIHVKLNENSMTWCLLILFHCRVCWLNCWIYIFQDLRASGSPIDRSIGCNPYKWKLVEPIGAKSLYGRPRPCGPMSCIDSDRTRGFTQGFHWKHGPQHSEVDFTGFHDLCFHFS